MVYISIDGTECMYTCINYGHPLKSIFLTYWYKICKLSVVWLKFKSTLWETVSLTNVCYF